MSIWKFIFAGNLPAGDVFNHTCYFEDPGSATLGQAAAAANAYLTALLTTASGMQNSFTTTTTWGTPRIERISAVDGSTIDTFFGSVTGAGTNSTQSPLPPEVAICVTKRTMNDTPTTRGRMYLPAPVATALTAQGAITTAVINAVLLSVQAAARAANAAPGAFAAVVWSQKTLSWHLVTAWEVGNVYDSQRRRRNKIIETRSSIAA